MALRLLKDRRQFGMPNRDGGIFKHVKSQIENFVIDQTIQTKN